MEVTTLRYGNETGWSAPFPTHDSEQTLLLVFASPEFIDDPVPLRDLRKAFPRAAILGCSTAGEILGATIDDRSVAVAVLRFERTTLAEVSAAVHRSSDSRAAGQTLGRALARPSLRGVLMLSDGLSVNGSELLRGIEDAAPGIPVSGGLAADGSRFKRTWVMSGDAIEEDCVAAIGLYGDHVHVSHGSQGGWDIFGPERVVTRSLGNVLYELDGQPALALYKKYLGERAEGLPATALLFPLSVRATRGDEPTVRTILAVDEAESSLTFAGDIPQGAHAQLMRANLDRLIDGASTAASMVSPSEGVGDDVVVAVSCVGRRLVLGVRAEEEVEAVGRVLGASNVVGFYSYGEVSPSGRGRSALHNQTMTLTRIRET